MFGNNPIRKQDLDPAGSLVVHSVFGTIQGEGPYAGQPAIFVRLAGCNLRCTFCDTDFESVRETYSLDRLLDRVEHERKQCNADLVVITGGEPMLQNLVPFIRELIMAHGMRVQIETAGTVWVPGLEAFVDSIGHQSRYFDIVCSPKSGKVHEQIAAHCRNYKYIVSASMPIDWYRGIPFNVTQSIFKKDAQVARVHRVFPSLYFPRDSDAAIWLQPCDEQESIANQANLDLCARLAMKHGYRISIQQHKILGLE